MSELVTVIFLISGSCFILIAAIGILNMPDVLCRAHALTKALTLGISLMLIALFGKFGTYSSGLKVILAIMFQLFTIPLSGHIFALYAYRRKQKDG